MYMLNLIMAFFSLAVPGSDKLVIDSFEYANGTIAQNVWESQAGSLPAEVTPHKTEQGDKAMILRCDFSNKTERCYWDREVKLDLTRFGRFSLQVYSENPHAIRWGTLYFQSGNGWYSGSFDAGKKGWQNLSLLKSSFRAEGSPTGWDSVNRIRLSFWKSEDTDTVVAVDNLEAIFDEIVIVLGDLSMRDDPQQARTIRSMADSMVRVLEDSGLEFGVVNDTEVESGVLSGPKLAIFPYNPDISDRECEAVAQFVKSGGKLMLFYSLPDRLADLLGIEKAGWMREEYPGQFASISLKADEGSPETIAQGSWNVTIPRPKAPQAEVAGIWTDNDGKSTNIPAITIHPNGLFMGHVLLPGDSLNKSQMLMAFLGKLMPDMRGYFAGTILKSAGKIAGFNNFDESSRFIRDNMMTITEDRRLKASDHLAESKKLFAQAEKSDRYGETLKVSRRAMEELQEALFLSFPSKKGEFRALWCHSAFGISGWNWDQAVERIKKNGFTAVVPNMLWGGLAYYPGDVLPVAKEVADRGDQIAQCLAACRKYGIQVHVWKVNWNLSNAPDDFVEKMRKDGRLQKDRAGNEVKWLCPSHPDNFSLELESMLEIVRKYDVDGIHFDYIRYPDENSCYCPTCREGFEKKGIKVENWPGDVINGIHAEAFSQWRCDQITRLVKSVSEQARKIKKIKISAAVFNDYPGCRKSVGQDWKAWIESGYLDFVCPMDYTADNDRFCNLVANQKNVVNGRIPLYPGIGASAPGLQPDQVAMQAHLARSLGADGFIIFNYDSQVAKTVLPALFKGISSQ